MRPAKPPPGVPAASWIYRFAAWVGIIVMRIQRWMLDVRGLEHVPTRGGCVLAANHQSFWDFFVVARAPYERLGRPSRILAKASLWNVPVFGRLIRATKCIPVDRSNGGDALEHAVGALAEGELVLVLPESTISQSFDLLPFRLGAARMAIQAGVPIVPAASWGSQRFFTTGRRIRWRWKLPVTVRYGEPIQVKPGDDPEVVTKELRERIQALLDEAIAAYPDGSPPGAWWVPDRLGGGARRHADVEREYHEWRNGWRRNDPAES